MRFISHELRTPLNSVFMGMQLSLDQIPEDTQEPVELERRETLLETQSACGVALEILNELLLFDKLETGALVLNKLTVPVPELVEDSIKMFSVQAREKSVDISITNNADESSFSLVTADHQYPALDGSGGSSDMAVMGDASLTPQLYNTDEVSVDKNKVVQVIRNVVSNAIKFTPAFGKIQINLKFVPTPAVLPMTHRSTRLSLTSPCPVLPSTGYQPLPSYPPEYDADLEMNGSDPLLGPRMVGLEASYRDKRVRGELVIEIRDDGAGISEENQRRLFKEVVQFHPELLKNGGGSGLGMCISKGIMDMHGGSISVYSAGEGKGSLFTLRLPMTRCISDSACRPSIYVPVRPAMSRKPSICLSRHKAMSSRVSFGIITDSLPSPSLLSPLSAECSPLTVSLRSTQPVPFPESAISTVPPSIKAAYIRATAVTAAAPAPAATTTAESATEEVAAVVESERPLRFLVVDDSQMNRKMLCRILKNKGHECTEAEDGVQAVAIVTAASNNRQDASFDMILMDFM